MTTQPPTPPQPPVPPPTPEPPKDELKEAQEALKAEQARVAALTAQYNAVAKQTLDALPEADRGLVVAIAGDDVTKQLEVMSSLRAAGKISTVTAVPQPPPNDPPPPPTPPVPPPGDRTRVSGLPGAQPPPPQTERDYHRSFAAAAIARKQQQ